jgi:hypothetical protein
MITADKLRLLTNMPTFMLTEAIQKQGYKKDKFETSEFLGMTNAGQFCYKVSYIEDNELHDTKVFVSHDIATGKVSVDY